ncbi:hypothetical protein [Anoxybacteroides rupiense]|nr:hypothetical protein [Anoxybacillus rupiensis]
MLLGFLFYIVLCAVELAGAHLALREAPKQEEEDPFHAFFH